MVYWFFYLPPFVPVGKFRTVTDYFTQKRFATRFEVHGDVVAKH